MTPRSYPVVVAKRAAEDIDAAVSFIALDSPLEAERWCEGCIDAIRSLAELPRIWPPAAEPALAKVGVRSRVFNLVRDAEVVVVCVRHGAMRPLTLSNFLSQLRG